MIFESAILMKYLHCRLCMHQCLLLQHRYEDLGWSGKYFDTSTSRVLAWRLRPKSSSVEDSAVWHSRRCLPIRWPSVRFRRIVATSRWPDKRYRRRQKASPDTQVWATQSRKKIGRRQHTEDAEETFWKKSRQF